MNVNTNVYFLQDLNINKVTLTEKDIYGASLAGRYPTILIKQELKFWLDCRAIRHTKLKTKAELAARYDSDDSDEQYWNAYHMSVLLFIYKMTHNIIIV